jgi:type IV pilus assembly protein PilE
MRKTTSGFTLLELLTVVGIIAILAAISVPFYNDYVIRSKITEATSSLSDGRVKMEQFFQDNRTYTGGPAPASTTYFDYAVTASSKTAYTLKATGKASMLGYDFTIDQNNTRSTTAAPSNWAPGSGIPASCWVVRKRSC